jgi:hypothetical protein
VFASFYIRSHFIPAVHWRASQFKGVGCCDFNGFIAALLRPHPGSLFNSFASNARWTNFSSR